MTQFHVNGLATIWVDYGEGDTVLGYSIDGVTIDMNFESEMVFTDKWGPKVPEDVLNQGQWATVRCQLVKYNNEPLQAVKERLTGVTSNYGGLPNEYSDDTIAIGALMKQCDHLITLSVDRGTTCTELGTGIEYEGGWQFKGAYLADTDSFQVGTRVTSHDLTFRCIPDASGLLFTKTSGLS